MGGCLNCVNSGRGNVSHRSWNAFLGTNDRVTSKKLTRKIEIFLVRGCSFETEELLVYLYVQNADRHAVLIFTAPGNNVWKILHQPSNLVGTWKKKSCCMPKKQKWGQQNADRETTDARGVLSWEAVPAAFALYCASLLSLNRPSAQTAPTLQKSDKGLV